MAKIVSAAEFDSEVLKSEVPVLVDFFATWCGPCKMIAPTLEELSAEYEGRAKIIKVDIDKDRDLAKSYEVRSVPTLIFFKDGKAVDTKIGALGKPDLAAIIDKMM